MSLGVIYWIYHGQRDKGAFPGCPGGGQVTRAEAESLVSTWVVSIHAHFLRLLHDIAQAIRVDVSEGDPMTFKTTRKPSSRYMMPTRMNGLYIYLEMVCQMI